MADLLLVMGLLMGVGMSSPTNTPEEMLVEQLEDDGVYPNSRLPALVYRNAVRVETGGASVFEELFHSNNWGNSWRNGIYSYHHYHSTAHEVLGIYSGRAKVQLGGPAGIQVEVSAGDVVVIPAGVAHKNLGSSSDFRCVGAYPAGQSWDMNYGKEGERPAADENISRVFLPSTDPVYGDKGPLLKHWKRTD